MDNRESYVQKSETRLPSCPCSNQMPLESTSGRQRYLSLFLRIGIRNQSILGTFTEDFERLADWLQHCKIRTVAMESTGVFWIPLFQILEHRNIQVLPANAQHVKNVPGRKTDVEDCQWLQHLRAIGLLRGSFRPNHEICAIRSLWRHRDNLIQLAMVHLQHMQKSLDQMYLRSIM